MAFTEGLHEESTYNKQLFHGRGLPVHLEAFLSSVKLLFILTHIFLIIENNFSTIT